MIGVNIFDTLPRDCWVKINTEQLTNNLRILNKFVQTPVLAVVKANAYGHGYVYAAHAFLNGGASYLGVASLAEAMLLRQTGINAPILIISGILPSEMIKAAQNGFEFFVWNKHHLDVLRETASKSSPVRVHIKVNTGMGRLGCWPHEAVSISTELDRIHGVEITGLATHFGSAYDLTLPDTSRQIEQFNQIIHSLAIIGIRPRIIHAANSFGALCYPNMRFDMVRMGISLYGVPPSDILALPDGVKTALTWHTRITSTNVLPKGHAVGYFREYIMPETG